MLSTRDTSDEDRCPLASADATWCTMGAMLPTSPAPAGAKLHAGGAMKDDCCCCWWCCGTWKPPPLPPQQLQASCWRARRDSLNCCWMAASSAAERGARASLIASLAAFGSRRGFDSASCASLNRLAHRLLVLPPPTTVDVVVLCGDPCCCCAVVAESKLLEGCNSCSGFLCELARCRCACMPIAVVGWVIGWCVVPLYAVCWTLRVARTADTDRQHSIGNHTPLIGP